MGGYAAYVWPAYGFAALVLIALLVQSWRGRGAARRSSNRCAASPVPSCEQAEAAAGAGGAPRQRRDRRAGDRLIPCACASNNA